MLAAVAGDTASAPGIAASAAATLIELLAAEGQLAEAAARLEHFRSALGMDEYLHLRRVVAAGHARNGDLVQAERLLVADSSVEAIALQGRFRLYAGDLRGASDALRQAGPFAGSRSDATERAALLALLQLIEADSVPELGAAFQLLDRGDSTAAAARFEQVARGLPADKGGAELRLFAGRLLAGRDPTEAERLFRAARLPEAPGAAAAASLELARLLIRLERRAEAMETLEQMILAYPGSALVPQARRLLDQARSAVPRT
jgi:tetratricopeptide (TPR) repeat protein